MTCLVTPVAHSESSNRIRSSESEPGRTVLRQAAARLTAVVISGKEELSPWVESRFTQGQSPDDADGGSAVPISPDGYFITADHVLSRSEGRNVFVVHGQQGGLRATRARIVWRSASTDLALLHIPVATPRYYTWTSPDRWLPAGTPVIHSGIATGFQARARKRIAAHVRRNLGWEATVSAIERVYKRALGI